LTDNLELWLLLVRPNLPKPKIWTPAHVQGEDEVSDSGDEADEVRSGSSSSPGPSSWVQGSESGCMPLSVAVELSAWALAVAQGRRAGMTSYARQSLRALRGNHTDLVACCYEQRETDTCNDKQSQQRCLIFFGAVKFYDPMSITLLSSTVVAGACDLRTGASAGYPGTGTSPPGTQRHLCLQVYSTLGTPGYLPVQIVCTFFRKL